MAAASEEDAQRVQSAEDTATEQFMAVVDQAARKTEAAPLYARKAWFVLDRDSFPRKQAIAIVDNPWFDHIILALIGANCITMMVFNEPVLKSMIEGHPNDFDVRSTWAFHDRNKGPFSPLPGCELGAATSGPCSISDWIDFIFLSLFAVEMCLKMLAQGLVMHPNAYLRSGWNWLDFIVVVVGFIETYSSGLPGISTLRLVKTLRPLRSLQRIRGMRVLVQCILEAMPQMCNVLSTPHAPPPPPTFTPSPCRPSTRRPRAPPACASPVALPSSRCVQSSSFSSSSSLPSSALPSSRAACGTRATRAAMS
jgi:hypothetical protein